MSSTLTSNMSLIVPGVGTEAGPTYATDINSSLSIIDSHNHTPGSGVLITPLAMNINSALTFAGNSATNVKALTFTTQTTTQAASSLYVKLGSETTPLNDLWYNDGSNDIQLTSAGAVNATIASIPGETYGGGTFTWRQVALPTTPANFDIGSITIRPNTAATTAGITLTPYSGIASAISLVLPALPASTSFLSMDSSGNIVASIPTLATLTTANLSASAAIIGTQLSATANILGTQLSASANVLGSQLSASANIVGTQLSASAGITGTQLTLAAAITPGQNDTANTGYLAGVSGIAYTANSTTPTLVTGLNATMSNFTIGRPVFAQLNGGTVSVTAGSAATITILATGSLHSQTIGTFTIPAGTSHPSSVIQCAAFLSIPDVYTNYKVFGSVVTGGQTLTVSSGVSLTVFQV